MPTIGIFTFNHPATGNWDPDSIQSGITGSEEAVIYLSKELAKLGYDVFVSGNPAPFSPHSLATKNPRFVKTPYDDGTFFDIGIAWRMPQCGAALKKRARKVYFWPHDYCNVRLTDEEIASFDDVLWLSKTQRTEWCSINPGLAQFTHIFGNGIDPEQLEPVKSRANPWSCIYASDYLRGLEVLLETWPEVKKGFPRATLDVYYGRHPTLLKRRIEKIYALLEAVRPFDVTEHGLVGHKVLNQAYGRASFWTYPYIGKSETFCISALRAQASGAIPVIIERGALKEVVRYGFKCKSRRAYQKTLEEALERAEEITLKDRQEMRGFVLKEHTWEQVARRWKRLFDKINY